MSFSHHLLRMICLAGVLASGLAAADTVNLTTVTVVDGKELTVSGTVPFRPKAPTITVKLCGLTCTFISSASGAGQGQGCNYWLTYNVSNGKLSGFNSVGGGCTSTAQMQAACK